MQRGQKPLVWQELSAGTESRKTGNYILPLRNKTSRVPVFDGKPSKFSIFNASLFKHYAEDERESEGACKHVFGKIRQRAQSRSGAKSCLQWVRGALQPPKLLNMSILAMRQNSQQLMQKRLTAGQRLKLRASHYLETSVSFLPGGCSDSMSDVKPCTGRLVYKVEEEVEIVIWKTEVMTPTWLKFTVL